jgi:hypothetical protein
MTTRTTWAALVVIGATAVLDLGCSGHARGTAGEPTTPSSAAKAAPSSSSDDPATGSTSQAMTSSAPSSATPPADPPAKTEPLKSDPPGRTDVPGVGNQRKAEGTQPGQVGKGPSKKSAEKKAAEPHGKKKQAKAAPKSTKTTKVAANAKKKK